MEIRFWQVGGCVRDSLLGLKTKDIDFAVEVFGAGSTSIAFAAMQEAVHARCSKVFLETPEFFTIRGLDPELGAVDFVLARKDGPSSDGRHPDWVEAGTIYDDLARRDFTVNAMARHDNGHVLDPHGGLVDLDARLLRFVGKPEDRLREDALRAFRALRFTITKDFTIAPSTRDALRRMEAGDFDAVSTERIRDELFKMFAKDTADSLLLFMRFPVLLDLAFSRGLWLKPTSEDP